MNFISSLSIKLFLVCLFIVISSRLASAQGFAWAQGIISPSGVGMPSVIASTTDANNNGLFVGAFNGTVDFDPGPGVQNLTAVGNLNMFILKKDAAGNFLWVKHISGISPNMYGCYGRNISVDSFGNIM